MSSVFTCPFCSYTAGEIGSVKGHITRKTDDKHKGKSGPDYEGDIDTVEYESDDSVESTVTDDSVESGHSVAPVADGGVVPEEYRAPEGSSESACCDDPELEGSAGDCYRLEDGSVVRLEEGDEICVNCDSIHE